MKWEKLPNGKWKPLKEFKKPVNGKYDYDDPIYKKRMKERMNKIKLFCHTCGTYTLLNPCVHHLPDGYKNEMRRKAYKKAISESKSLTERKPNKELTSNS